MRTLVDIVKKTELTVTYNFDDFIERGIHKTISDEERKESKGYEVVTNPWSQFKRNDAIIYHTNGIVSLQPMEQPTDKIVFSEASFAEQLLGHSNGDNAGLLNHLSKKTCLFIGLSLEDETLRATLVRSAKQNPGNYHYYVHYTKASSLTEEDKDAIKLTNFRVYNLITLFLDENGIADFLDLIDMKEPAFLDSCQRCDVNPAFRYYFTGPLGVGKSTTLNNLRNLTVYDEWLEQRPAILGKPWEDLTDAERDKVDNWIVGQFKLKNDKLRYKNNGIFVIDRAPMDPLAFTKPDGRPDKAKNLMEAYSPEEAKYTVLPGMIFFMTGDFKELSLRMKLTNRPDYNETKLKNMDNDLKEVYGERNLAVIDTTSLSIHEVVKKVAEIIHLGEYKPVVIHDLLQAAIKGTI